MIGILNQSEFFSYFKRVSLNSWRGIEIKTCIYKV